MTYWISQKHATFIIIEENGKIVKAAPVANWTIGKSVDNVLDYFRKKNAQIIVW